MKKQMNRQREVKSNSELDNRSILTDYHSQPASPFLLSQRKYKQVITAGKSQMSTKLEEKKT